MQGCRPESSAQAVASEEELLGCCAEAEEQQGVQMVETEADSLEAEETFLEPSPEMESEGLLLETIQSAQLWGSGVASVSYSRLSPPRAGEGAAAAKSSQVKGRES